jgi:uncharacterized protein
MNKKEIIEEIKKYLKKNFKTDATGHDWWHFYRVWKMAKEIAKKEGGNLFVIELAALLHDIADYKFNNGDDKAGGKTARILLKKLNVNKELIEQVCQIVDNVSFKGAGIKNGIKTKEGMIVQDADRLDVMGAIGIARTLAYGGFTKREIYNPAVRPRLYKTFEEYKNNRSSSINHFYEKLLLLENTLNTKTAKKIGKERHVFMENYLKRFFKEWNVEISD